MNLRFRRPSALLLLSLCGLGCASVVPASFANWTPLGERTVNHRVERDEITVGARDGTFERIKLVVRGRAVTFRDVEVHYLNGTRQDVALRSTLRAGGETRASDLVGQDRRIARVTFVYDAVALHDAGPRRGGRRGGGRREDGPAVVALYGWP